MSDIDTRIQDQRDQLDAFASEARDYLDALSRELDGRMRQIAGGLGAAPDSVAEDGGSSFDTGSYFGRALDAGVATGLTGLLNGRSGDSVLRSTANSVGRVIGQGLSAALGLTGEEGMRLSEGQSAGEQSSLFSLAQRNS